jgi:hypothetical protein
VIEPASDGQTLRSRWTKWAVAGTTSGKVQDVGLVSEVVWRIENGTLTREETLSSKQPVNIRRWWLAVPTTHDKVETEMLKYRFSSAKGTLEVRVSDANFPVKASIIATGNSALGRGVHGAIPLHLVLEAKNIDVRSPLKYKISLTVFATDSHR